MDREIEAAAAQLEKLERDKAAIDDQIKALEKKILDIGGARLLTQKSKVDGLHLHINLANDEITKAEVAKAKAEKDVKKLEGVVTTNSASLAEITEDLQALEEELEECVQYVEEIRSKVADAQTAAENSKDDLDNLKAELEEKQFKVKLTVIDTPGFGDYVNNRDSWVPIIDFVDDQHEIYMRQEQQPMRADKSDLRVHACLYFIRPTGHTYVSQSSRMHFSP